MNRRPKKDFRFSLVKVQGNILLIVLALLVWPNIGETEELRKEERIRFAQKIFREVSQMVPPIPDKFFTSGYEGRIEGEKLSLLKYIGKSQGGIGDGEGLRETVARAIPLSQKRGYMAVTLTQLAKAQRRAGFLEDSIATTNAALEVALSHKTDPMFDSHLYFIWVTFMNAGEFSQAVETAKMNSSHWDIGKALEVIGFHLAQAGQLEQAQKLREESENIGETIDDPQEKAFFLLEKIRNMMKEKKLKAAGRTLEQAKISVRAISEPEERATLLMKIAIQAKKLGEVTMYQELLGEVRGDIQIIPDAYDRVRRYLDMASTVAEESGKDSALPLIQKAFDEAQLIPDLSGKVGALLRVADTELELEESKKAEEMILLAIGAIEGEAIPDQKISAIQQFRTWKDVWEKLGPEELGRLEYILKSLPSDIENDQHYDLSLLVDLKMQSGSLDKALDTADRMENDPESKAVAIYKVARAKVGLEPLNICMKWAKGLVSPLDRVNAMYGIAMGLLDET